MGRFKVYDPRDVVNILEDDKYATCQMCDKKLKNVMGNIKRHYEQIHDIVLNANGTRQESKCKRKWFKYDDDDDYKVTPKAKNKIKVNKKTSSSKKGKKLQKNRMEVEEKVEPEDDKSLSEAPRDIIGSIVKRSKIEFNCDSQHSSESYLGYNTKEQEEAENSNDEEIYIVDIDLKDTPTIQIKKDDNESESVINNEKEIESFSYINKIQIGSLESCHLDDYLNCLIETKTKINIPFKDLLEGNSLQAGLQLDKDTSKSNLNTQTIGQHLHKMVNKLHQEITNILANRIVHLKLDIASTKNRNVMLANIQFIKDFEINIFTLSIFELLPNHPATYLKEKVLSTLKLYDIDMSRVYSITKDNINIGEESLELDICSQTSERNDSNGTKEAKEYCQHLSEHFPGHAIHFAVCDIIQQLNENISQSRDSAKRLRLQMRKLNLSPFPVLDNISSWFSIYDMIKSIIDIREKVENNSDLTAEVDWIFMVKFEASFRPVVKTAMIFKSQQNLLMGDFYREWLLCELELMELAQSNELSLYLLDALHKRKSNMFENSSFLSALYLDPRFCYNKSSHLSDTQKEKAITQLLQIFNKLKTLPERETDSISTEGRYEKLEKTFVQKSKSKVQVELVKPYSFNMDINRVTASLKQLQFVERLPIQTNILDYWKMAKYKDSTLARIAEIALAAPATQTTINRAINAWPMTVMQNKFNVHTSNLENILLIKLNQDLVDKISLK